VPKRRPKLDDTRRFAAYLSPVAFPCEFRDYAATRWLLRCALDFPVPRDFHVSFFLNYTIFTELSKAKFSFSGFTLTFLGLIQLIFTLIVS